MKEERDRLNEAFGKTSDIFHQRVERTLFILQAEKRRDTP